MGIKRIRINVIITVLLIGFATGCAHKSGPWLMPAKQGKSSAIVFGTMRIPPNIDKHLLLRNINLMKKGKTYIGMGRGGLGEKLTVLSDNSFVAANIEPGTYYISGFDAGNIYHSIPPKQIKYFKVYPGQLKFVGSYHYIAGKSSFFGPGSFSLKIAKKPSEFTLLRWLESISYGSGWEKAIHKRIRKLGGKPKLRPKKLKNTK